MQAGLFAIFELGPGPSSEYYDCVTTKQRKFHKIELIMQGTRGELVVPARSQVLGHGKKTETTRH